MLDFTWHFIYSSFHGPTLTFVTNFSEFYISKIGKISSRYKKNVFSRSSSSPVKRYKYDLMSVLGGCKTAPIVQKNAKNTATATHRWHISPLPPRCVGFCWNVKMVHHIVWIEKKLRKFWDNNIFHPKHVRTARRRKNSWTDLGPSLLLPQRVNLITTIIYTYLLLDTELRINNVLLNWISSRF